MKYSTTMSIVWDGFVPIFFLYGLCVSEIIVKFEKYGKKLLAAFAAPH